jgi:hypothetical protein
VIHEPAGKRVAQATAKLESLRMASRRRSMPASFWALLDSSRAEALK